MKKKRRNKVFRPKPNGAKQVRDFVRKKQNPQAFRDNQGNVLSPIELVFPILEMANNKFKAVGTGFFVHPAGGFVTAKHNMVDHRGNLNKNCFAVHSIGSSQHLIREIQYFEPHPIADIGMGMLKGQLQRSNGELFLKASFLISLKPPVLNEQVKTFAYPDMTIDEEQIGAFPGDWYEGIIQEFLPQGTAWLKDECFQTNMLIKSGASGGPVLRGNRIIGVNSSSMSLADGEEPISFITPITKIFDLKLKDSDGKVVTVKQLMETGHMAFANG